MNKITPVGQKMIVSPLPQQDTVTDSNIIVMDLQLSKGEVMEVSDELKDLYKPGDVVIFPQGTGVSIQYKKKSCVWVNANLDIWGIVNEK